MSTSAVRAVLWDADGVLQSTPAYSWDLAVQVVAQIPDALIGADVTEDSIRVIASRLGLGDRVEDIVSVFSTFEVSNEVFDVVSQVRGMGTACYLATNQDRYRAAGMRKNTPYDQALDGSYYSCDIGVAKPSTAFFECIASDLGLAPAQLLFLDDQPRNVAAARSAGLNAEKWVQADGLECLTDILGVHRIRLTADPT